jgi:transcriptional regulator of acetoin/glycerol metabolism
VTREERARANTKAREEKARTKVINAITGLMSNEYKKLNGKWNISKISKELEMDRATVSKHIKKYELTYQ